MLVRNFFLEVFSGVTHDGLSEKGTTRSLNHHKNTTAIRPDKLTIASTHHGNRTALRISNATRFAVLFPCTRLFWRDRNHTPAAIWNYILYTKSRKCTCYVRHYITSAFYFYNVK